MVSKVPIRCFCNQEIGLENILQIGVYLKAEGPSFILLKFRCPKCNNYGEIVIEQTDLLEFIKLGNLTEEEQKKFKKMGKITPEELLEFHKKLKKI
jgi:hypothetical protein